MSVNVKQDWYVPITYPIVKATLLATARALWVRDIKGLENIPKQGGAIVALNHQSYLDFLCFSSISPRKVTYLAAEKLFQSPGWCLLMKSTGQIRVERLSSNKQSVHETVIQRLNDGALIGIFPEGTRSGHPTDMLPAFTGVARFAFDSRVPVIPVGVIGTYELQSRHQKLPKLSKRVTLNIGTPMFFEGESSDRVACANATQRIMREIGRLSGRTVSESTRGDDSESQ